jgi:ubiquinone/menaquinone biosynthesis C-methylase UbiE
MGIYERYLLPKLLNLVMQSPEMMGLRRQLIPMAEGRVLELGIGSGLNLPFYRDDVQVTGVDPSLELQSYARQIADEHEIDVEFVADSAEHLHFEDKTFDSVVITWTLCTIPDPIAALREVRRVLRPEGKIIFAEHGKSPEPHVEKWQHRINRPWRAVSGGCNLNRQPDQSLIETGFKLVDVKTGYLKGPRWATYNYRGIASH